MSPALEVSGVVVRLGGRVVLDGAGLQAMPGEVLGVVGANGAGKTTLLRVALGLQPADVGVVRLGGRPIGGLSETARARLAGYLPQERKVAWNLSALSLASLGAVHQPPALALAAGGEALARVGLATLKGRGVLDMSGGERARVLLARLLATRAPLLAADEPAAGLDPDAQLLVLDILRQETRRGAAVVLTLHDLTLAARFCDRLVALKDGKVIAEGAPDAVLSPQGLRSIFGLDGVLIDTPHGPVAALGTERAMNLPTFDDVLDASARLEGWAVRTPMIRHEALDAATGARVFVKAECLQRTGSFKFRGAYNRISRLTRDELKRGVVAFSSGNHAQGVAAAAGLMKTPALIVMPSDAPAAKIEGTRALGGEVVLYDRWTQSREAIAAEIGRERGAVVVPAFEDFHVIAGQGTAGLEAARQLQARGAAADILLCPVSGGGLIAGVGLAFQALSPQTRLFAVEPEGYDDHALSLAAGHPVTVKPQRASLLDALMAPAPGALTFALNGKRLAGALTVSDDEALAAMAFAFRHLKVVLEPGGASALAAVLAGQLDVRGQTVLVMASGGNVDAALYARALGV